MSENKSEAIAVLRWQVPGEEPHALYLHKEETIEIGRLESNDLYFSNPKVSRQHALIVWQDSAFQIKDLRSHNGTFVNKKKISEVHTLKDGDMIGLDVEVLTFYEITRPESVIEKINLKSDTIVFPKKNTQPRLVVTSGPQEGRQILLVAEKMIIGRATEKDDWDIDLQEKAVSRPHAELIKESGRFKINDLDSANGTLVNGKWIKEPVELENGDLIEIGETMLVFRSR